MKRYQCYKVELTFHLRQVHGDGGPPYKVPSDIQHAEE